MTDAAHQASHNQFGDLPVWDLDDLYPGTESAEFEAALGKARTDAADFENAHKGKLAERAAKGTLMEAISAYESLSDLVGRLGSYAQLYYVLDTIDPDRAKFMGDVQQALTDLSAKLIFFELEINRIADELLEQALSSDRELGRYRPWFDELR